MSAWAALAYSQEEDTPAASLPDQVEEEVKEHRAEILMDRQMAIMEAQGLELVGQTLEVLVEGFDRYAECWFGRSYRDARTLTARCSSPPRASAPAGELCKGYRHRLHGLRPHGELVE